MYHHQRDRLKFLYFDRLHLVPKRREVFSPEDCESQRNKMKKERGLLWHKKKCSCWNTETRHRHRGGEMQRTEGIWKKYSCLKKCFLWKKISESWSCSYWFFSLFLISHFFIFPFLRQMQHNTSVWVHQVSSHMHGYNLVRTLWPEELITLTYI